MTRTRKYLIAAVAILVVIWLITLVTGGSHAPNRPGQSASSSNRAEAGAAAQPADAALLPPDYAVLQSRNPFGRGHGRGARGAGGPDAGFVFEGAVESARGFTAFVENVAAKNVMEVVVGDALGRGHVRSINLDGMDYEVAGNRRRIEVGQNLNGETPPPPPPPVTKPSGPPAQPNGAPPQMPPGMPMPPPGVQVQMGGGGGN